MADPQIATTDNFGLAELLVEHIRKLNEKLYGAFSIEDVEADLHEISELLRFFKERDEMLEKLIDDQTREDRKAQLLANLQAQHLLVAENRAELERTHQRSHKLLLKSVSLVTASRRKIEKLTTRHGDYASEVCASCGGLGGTPTSPCPVCAGYGTVLVHQPSMRCPRCGGIGKSGRNLFTTFDDPELCIVCRGSGWVLTKD